MSAMKLAFSAMTLACLRSVEGLAAGSLKLDNLTFDKLVTVKNHSFLVKFDDEPPSYKDYWKKQQEYMWLCEAAHPVERFIVADVLVQRYGNYENDALRKRFNLSFKDFPAYFIFDDENFHTGGKPYKGPLEAGRISAWIRQHGIPIGAPGIIPEMNDLAEQFIKDGGRQEKPIQQAMLNIVNLAKEDKKKGWLYVRIMEKIKEEGVEYIQKEMYRVEKILEEEGPKIVKTVDENKLALMKQKYRILHWMADHLPQRDEL